MDNDNVRPDFSAAVEEMKREARKQVELNEKQFAADVEHVMSTPHGRRFLWALLQQTNVFGPAFTGNSETYYNLGRQDLGKWIYAKARGTSLELWRKAEDENIQRRGEV